MSCRAEVAGKALFACIRAPRTPDLAHAVAKEFSPRVQRYPNGCVVLDVGGLGMLLGDAQAIGTELFRACTARDASRPVSVAVAPTQMGALLMSSAASGLTVVNELSSALAPLPLQVLHRLLAEIHGVTVRPSKRAAVHARQAAHWDAYEDAFRVFERWGLITLADLTALAPGELAARLGQEGVAIQTLARGIDRRPLAPDPDVPRFLQRIELEWPIDGLEPLSFVLARLLEPLSAALERADRGAAAIRLDLRLVDRTAHSRVLPLPAAMRDPRVLRTLLVLDLESHPPPAAIDVVAIEVDPAPGRVLQYSLLERARPSTETLVTLMARLGALVGESRVGQARLRDSHAPDRFEMRPFAPDDRPMPIRLQRPDLPCLRRFRPPVAIRVGVEHGRPIRVAIDRRGMPGGHVEQCAGPWRSSGAWWDGEAGQWSRDEWDVSLSDGSVCRLFRERGRGTWFMEGIVD